MYGVLLDLDQRTLSFVDQDNHCGIAYRNLPAGCRFFPAIGLGCLWTNKYVANFNATCRSVKVERQMSWQLPRALQLQPVWFHSLLASRSLLESLKDGRIPFDLLCKSFVNSLTTQYTQQFCYDPEMRTTVSLWDSNHIDYLQLEVQVPWATSLEITSTTSTRSVTRICLLEEGSALGVELPSLLGNGSRERNLIGATVVRGSKWKFDDEDGGAGNRGRIVAAKMHHRPIEFEVQVQWAGCTNVRKKYWVGKNHSALRVLSLGGSTIIQAGGKCTLCLFFKKLRCDFEFGRADDSGSEASVVAEEKTESEGDEEEINSMKVNESTEATLAEEEDETDAVAQKIDISSSFGRVFLEQVGAPEFDNVRLPFPTLISATQPKCHGTSLMPRWLDIAARTSQSDQNRRSAQVRPSERIRRMMQDLQDRLLSFGAAPRCAAILSRWQRADMRGLRPECKFVAQEMTDLIARASGGRISRTDYNTYLLPVIGNPLALRIDAVGRQIVSDSRPIDGAQFKRLCKQLGAGQEAGNGLDSRALFRLFLLWDLRRPQDNTLRRCQLFLERSVEAGKIVACAHKLDHSVSSFVAEYKLQVVPRFDPSVARLPHFEAEFRRFQDAMQLWNAKTDALLTRFVESQVSELNASRDTLSRQEVLELEWKDLPFNKTDFVLETFVSNHFALVAELMAPTLTQDFVAASDDRRGILKTQLIAAVTNQSLDLPWILETRFKILLHVNEVVGQSFSYLFADHLDNPQKVESVFTALLNGTAEQLKTDTVCDLARCRHLLLESTTRPLCYNLPSNGRAEDEDDEVSVVQNEAVKKENPGSAQHTYFGQAAEQLDSRADTLFQTKHKKDLRLWRIKVRAAESRLGIAEFGMDTEDEGGERMLHTLAGSVCATQSVCTL